ncbi:MAG: hypothetical protein A2X52_07695 [Candidatus Rokubacteria bacterium GWC2_70_16]|nr:MAG: hypothetical protein A2X52_07695 [Candidatus Rokubacteria bacterium GWC2_70_16]OGL20722.1 MAG: hypothetical protein A3K12_13970 [Candidatus Rokubacteria bacterium RIFCSPLOWO2_12_FULL_71_19]
MIAHEPPPRPRSGIGLDQTLCSLKGAAARRENVFKEQLKAQESKPKVLGRKFQEGLKKVKDYPEQPLRPIDLD